jgi:hypothetical protein
MAARVPSLETFMEMLRGEHKATSGHTVEFPVTASIFNSNSIHANMSEASTYSSTDLPYKVDKYQSGLHGQCNIWFTTGYVQITTPEGATHKLFVKVGDAFVFSYPLLTAALVWPGSSGERSTEQ